MAVAGAALCFFVADLGRLALALEMRAKMIH
jgi:hypothetical protein